MKNEGKYIFCKEKVEILKGYPVYLKVYDVSTVNKYYNLFGLGIYHSSILIYGIEYSYGSTPDGTSGIIEMMDESLNLKVKEKIYMGNTAYKFRDINELVRRLSKYWQGSHYDPFSKNCNHFTNYFAKKVLDKCSNFPSFVNKFINFELLCSCLYKPLKIVVYKLIIESVGI